MDHLAGSSANADIAGRARKVKKSMEDATFVAFCHFLVDVFAGITNFSLLLQRSATIKIQVTLNGEVSKLAGWWCYHKTTQSNGGNNQIHCQTLESKIL